MIRLSSCVESELMSFGDALSHRIEITLGTFIGLTVMYMEKLERNIDSEHVRELWPCVS